MRAALARDTAESSTNFSWRSGSSPFILLIYSQCSRHKSSNLCLGISSDLWLGTDGCRGFLLNGGCTHIIHLGLPNQVGWGTENRRVWQGNWWEKPGMDGGKSMWRHPRSSFQDEEERYLEMQEEVALMGVPKRKTWRWACERARESAQWWSCR